MLTLAEIKKFIDDDAASMKKRLAKTGKKYYEAEHDISKYKLFYYNASGDLVEDTYRSNIKIPHPFFLEIVDQAAQYMLSGKDAFVKSDNTNLQAKLDEYFNYNTDFTAELYDLVSGVMQMGFGYLYAYTKEDGTTAFQCADALGVVEVESRYTSDGKDYIIYWYVEKIDKNNKKIKRIQVVDEENTYFFVQNGSAGIVEDKCYHGKAVRPHKTFTKDDDSTIYYNSCGFIPFFRMDNNKKQVSDLHPIKALIDDYDLMACGMSNNIQDAAEYIVVARGFQGDSMEELIQNIKTKKHIGVDEDGGVDFKVVDIPFEARKEKLELDEKNIYRFGFAVNINALKDTSATTNIAIKFAYTLLDLKCNKLEIRLKQFLQQLVKVVLDEVNLMDGTDYQIKDVYFDFTREIPANMQENVQNKLTETQKRQVEINILLDLASYIDNKTMMELICEQLDIDYDEIKDKLPNPDDAVNDLTNAEGLLDE
ncbi:phage portal protein [Emergencia sp. 1XD21-10]|uniref:phage portal protein n=1 Tax=Emergencia sp. 1XD21-10 TaxID=2304569 RepID=UPI00137B449B|nr:phage portal protein [Emergencia sp. 1XD21-10]